MELSRRTPAFLLGLILIAFTTHGLYHSLGDYHKDLSKTPKELEKIIQNHPIFLVQMILFTLVIMGAYLVPKLPPHCKCKAKKRSLDWRSVRKESDKNYAARQKTRETRM
jgi:hypothetical protein